MTQLGKDATPLICHMDVKQMIKTILILDASVLEEKQMSFSPTPDDVEHAIFYVRWWKEFFLGLAAFAGILATMRKGKKLPVVAAISETKIDLKLVECSIQLKKEITNEFEIALDEQRRAIVNELKLTFENVMLKAKIKEED